MSNVQRICDIGIMKKRRNIALERLLGVVLNALQPFIKLIALKICFRPLEVKTAAKKLHFLFEPFL